MTFRFSSFPPQTLQTGLQRGKWNVRVSLPASHLQGNSQDFHSPADPHSPPHRSTGNRKGNFARTSAMPAALRFRVNQVLGHFSKGWELLLSEALWSPQPSDRPLLCLPIPFSLPAHPVFPPDLCPSSDPFTSLTPFFSCPTKTAASLSPLYPLKVPNYESDAS